MSLSEDDKAWINERLEKAEISFNERLEKMATSYNERLEKVAATLGQRIDNVATTFDEHLEKVETTFSQRLERVETTLLTEFHKWASPIHTRQRSHTAALRALDVELEDVEERVSKLEGKKAS